MKWRSTTKQNRISLRLASIAALILSSSATAFSIDSVTVLPSGTITADDPVTLEVRITTPSAPASLYKPTELVVIGNEIFVDIFPDAGPLLVLDSLLETVALGTFQPGTYEYTVVLTPAFEVGWGTRTLAGSFSVVDVCSLPPDPGPCDGVCERFFYNASTGQCEPFTYGCCKGNANNFLTLEECEAACPSIAPIPAVSEWGLILMAVIVLAVGAHVIRRRSAG